LYPVLVGFGSIVLFLLVLLRISGLLRTVQTQSELLAVMARSDALTGLPNRGTWDHELIRLTDDAREQGRPLTVALFDLDHFKRYNDTRGHIAGDRLLRELSSVWRSAVAGRGVLARYGGEEFGLAVPGMPLAEVEAIVASLCRLVPDGQCASVGMAAWHRDEAVPDLMSRVDSALYVAKRSGRNAVSVARAESGADFGSRTGRALTPRMVYQPIVDIVTGRVVAVEALARFDTSVLPPDEIFARAWLRGQGPKLEADAIASALRAASVFGSLPVHVNVSARGLVTPQVRSVLRASLRSVVIEVTEQDISADSAGMTAILDQFRRRGAQLAIDDFGVGFSNLRRMVGLRPEIIKLDRSLVMGIEHDAAARSVVAAVAHQAQLSGRIVCAEGVESAAERHTLMGLGVPHAQGYLFSRPIPAEELLPLLATSLALVPTGSRATG
jgi:diguanylate cyclase (GGDEF)-like protein